jgi:phosphatidylglycerophosphate synthase
VQDGERFTITDVRAAQKKRDAWWTVFLVDPYATRLTLWLANGTSITPNQLTSLALLFGVAAAASFAGETHTALITGALFFHLSFVVDCVDGKIARLKDTGSVFGMWLDYTFDRLRAISCAVTLMAGQYHRTGDVTYVWLAFAVITADLMRYLNAMQIDKMRGLMFGRLGIAGSQKAREATEHHRSARLRSMREAMERKRVRGTLFSGVEFQMFVFIVGPLTGWVKPITIASVAVLVLLELAAIYRVKVLANEYSRRMAQRPPTQRRRMPDR